MTQLFYSAATGGFYDPAVHAELPADASEITPEQHAALLQAQAQGLVIVPAADGSGQPDAVRKATVLTAAEHLRHLEIDVQVHLNRAAQVFGYEGIDRAISYAEDDVNPQWQAEGKAFRTWRSQVWQAFHRLTTDPGAYPSWPELREQLPMAPTKVPA